MTNSVRTPSLLIPGLLVSLVLVGCSDDESGKGNKTSATTKTTSASSTTTVTKTQSADTVKPPEVKNEVKTEATPAAKPETKPAEAKPPEGHVDVKAQPDEPDAPAAKPQATEPTKPADKPASKDQSNSPARNDAVASSSAAEDSAALKFSTIASAEDLANELNFLVVDAEKAVASEDEYKSQVEDRFVRDGNMIALLAIALALHDQESTLKAHAAAIADAAHKLAEAKDFATTSKAVADVKAALAGGTSGGELKWGKVATLNSLMKDEVPYLNKKLKDGLRHLKKRTKEASASAATMALIAENAKLYVADTQKPTEAAQWTVLANQFRAAAGEVAAKVHAGDEAGANAAMDKVNHSCHDCHAVFNPEK